MAPREALAEWGKFRIVRTSSAPVRKKLTVSLRLIYNPKQEANYAHRAFPEEWDAFSRKRALNDDRSALPVCCANISNFRDVILAIHENRGELTDKLTVMLHETWMDLYQAHGSDEGWHPTFLKFVTQAGLTWPVVGSS